MLLSATSSWTFCVLSRSSCAFSKLMLLLELGVELLTHRYVLVRDDTPAVGHAPVGYVDDPPVGQPVGIRGSCPNLLTSVSTKSPVL